jgi:hypothetical protein
MALQSQLHNIRSQLDSASQSQVPHFKAFHTKIALHCKQRTFSHVCLAVQAEKEYLPLSGFRTINRRGNCDQEVPIGVKVSGVAL